MKSATANANVKTYPESMAFKYQDDFQQQLHMIHVNHKNGVEAVTYLVNPS